MEVQKPVINTKIPQKIKIYGKYLGVLCVLVSLIHFSIWWINHTSWMSTLYMNSWSLRSWSIEYQQYRTFLIWFYGDTFLLLVGLIITLYSIIDIPSKSSTQYQ